MEAAIRTGVGPSMSAEEIIVAYHERTKHPRPPLRRVAGLHGLGHAAGSVPALRRRRSGSATAPEGGRRAPVLAALRRPEREAGPSGHRLDLDSLSLRSVADRIEERAGDQVVSARQSVERKPAPHGGIRGPASHRWPSRVPRRLPLRSEGTWSRTSGGGSPKCLDGADARVPRELLPGGPHLRSLAGSLEVRGARVPVLPARCRACARGHALRRCCPRMEALPPRPRERLDSLTGARPRS